MTDQDLALLEQLTYIDENLYKAAGITDDVTDIRRGMSVSTILEKFDDTAIENLRTTESYQVDGAWTDTNEWADIIEAIRNNDELMSLKVKDSYKTPDKSTTLGICYTNPSNPGKGYVTFKGTSGYEEWKDNVEGINTADTPAQLAAGEFINGIDSKITDITVVGHSKGANKAMYVTITDKSGANGESRITDCVALDGQGFSYKFIYKYAPEIYSRGKLITNYSISTDFVHVLMQQIPFSNQVYCQGYGMQNAGQYHSPASFFMQSDGSIIIDDGGTVFFNTNVAEDTNIKMIRRFVGFVMDTSTEYELDQIAELLGPVAGEILANHDTEAAINLLKNDPVTTALIIEKLVSFCDLYHYNIYDIANIILTFVFPDEEDRKWVMTIITLITLVICPELLIESRMRETVLAVLEFIKYAFMALTVAFIAALDFIVEKLIQFKDFIVEAAMEFARWFNNTWNAAMNKLRDFRDSFLATLKGIFDAIREIDFSDYSYYLLPYVCPGPIMFKINIDDELLGLHDGYRNMNSFDEETCQILDDIFNKANEADEEYASIINGEVDELEGLMQEFRTSFQFAG